MEFEETIVPISSIRNYHSISETHQTSYKKLLLKGTFSLLTILIAFFIPFSINSKDNPVCINDLFFNLTKQINKKLSNKIDIRITILILSSLSIDVIYFIFAFFWTKYGKSWRVIIVFTLYYSSRALIQSLFQMTTPAGYLWSYPGIPSLTVSYLKTNDFFPSGHVAFPLIVGLEFNHLKIPKMFYFCLFCAIFEGLVMVVMRGHYCIDILAGYILSHYCFIIVEKYCYLIDNSIFSMKLDEENIGLGLEEKKIEDSFRID